MNIEPLRSDAPDRSVTGLHRRRDEAQRATRWAQPSLLHRAAQRLTAAESSIEPLLRRISEPLLRGSLAIVYVWFGILKLAGMTPVADLVASTVPWLDRSWFVPLLGLTEVVLGMALLFGRFLTTISLILVSHLGGTFLVLVTQPELAFQHGNPMLLTTIGEFVVKNLVLASAAIAVAVLAGPEKRTQARRD